MAWIVLIAAGLLETVWAYSMKASNGFTHPVWSVMTMVTAGTSFWLLAWALKTLPLGTAYAVWTGIGAVGAAFIGILFLKEPASAVRLASIALIVAGIIGLRLASGGTNTP